MDQQLISDLFKLASKYMQKAGKLLEDYEKHSKTSKNSNSQEEKNLPVLKEPDLKKVKQEPQDNQESKERKSSLDQKERREKEKERKEKEKKEKKEKKEPSDSKHEKSSKPKKKNGYILYYEDQCREYKENHKGEKIDVRELSRAFSKQWRELDERMKSDYNDKAEEFNIINEAMADSLPQVRKHSIDLSDVSSDDPTPSKKKKTR